jgi:hypothetical protein
MTDDNEQDSFRNRLRIINYFEQLPLTEKALEYIDGNRTFPFQMQENIGPMKFVLPELV